MHTKLSAFSLAGLECERMVYVYISIFPLEPSNASYMYKNCIYIDEYVCSI